MPEVNITLVNDTPGEKVVAATLLELMQTFDLSRWAWVRDVRIDRYLPTLGQCFQEDGQFVIRLRSVRPSSLGQRVLAESDAWGLLRVYIHEQLHAYLDLKARETEAAIQELRGLYPDVPVGGEEGARSEFSTYLHLILCTLELDSLSSLIGEDSARKLMTDRPFYRFIYRTVLSDTDALRVLIRRHGLDLPLSP